MCTNVGYNIRALSPTTAHTASRFAENIGNSTTAIHCSFLNKKEPSGLVVLAFRNWSRAYGLQAVYTLHYFLPTTIMLRIVVLNGKEQKRQILTLPNFRFRYIAGTRETRSCSRPRLLLGLATVDHLAVFPVPSFRVCGILYSIARFLSIAPQLIPCLGPGRDA